MLTIKPETRVKALVLLAPAIDRCLAQSADKADSWDDLMQFVDAWADLQQQLPADYVAESFEMQFGVMLE